MASKFNINSVAVFLLLASISSSVQAQVKIFDVTKFGAKSNSDVTLVRTSVSLASLRKLILENIFLLILQISNFYAGSNECLEGGVRVRNV